MIVICSKCGIETRIYEFDSIGGDIVPVCSDCLDKKRLIDVLVGEQEFRFNTVLNNMNQSDLTKWIR